MSDVNDQAVPGSEQVDQSAVNEKLKGDNARLRQEMEAVLKNRDAALDETKKLKRIKNIIGAVGIDVDSEDAETALAAKLLSQQLTSEETAAATEAKPPAEVPAAKAQPDPLTDAKLQRMAKELEKMKAALEAEQAEKAAALEKNKADRIERQVVEALQKAGAANPTHLFKLMQEENKYRVGLTEEGSVYGGSEYDPKSLSDVVSALRDDDSYSYMFRATGATGAGTGPRNTGVSLGSSENPFHMDQVNATKAAMMLASNKEKAMRLISEARAAGKLDPMLAKIAG